MLLGVERGVVDKVADLVGEHKPGTSVEMVGPGAEDNPHRRAAEVQAGRALPRVVPLHNDGLVRVGCHSVGEPMPGVVNRSDGGLDDLCLPLRWVD